MAPVPYRKSGKLLIDRSGPVTTIILNRPKVHNALDRELSAEFNAVVREVNVDRECRILIIKGAGDTFCAGDDIKGFNDWTEDEGPWEVRMYQETANIIENMRPVTIAQVDGVCTGGGLEITLVCDFVVATDRSRWGMPEINWDITPGWGGTSRLAKFAGRRKAKEWNLTGILFDAKTAERYNLINHVSAPEKLEADVNALVDTMLDKSLTTVCCTKHFLNSAAEASTQIGLAFEGAPRRQTFKEAQGIRDFVDKKTRDVRRKLPTRLWQD
jgi:enoyl-CoA hydratase/carnithine racemase